MSSTKDTAVPSDLFPHVYSFLVECNLTKSAKSFKKECKVVSFVKLFVICMKVKDTLHFCTAFPDTKWTWTNAILPALSNQVRYL